MTRSTLHGLARSGCHGFDRMVLRKDQEIVREQYPDRFTLGERARMLCTTLASQQADVARCP